MLSDQIETVSFACREMMSMGKPTIVSDFACLPENVKTGETGWVTPVGDVEAIKQVVEAIFQNQDQLPSMGQAAREQAIQEFGIKLFADSTEAVYRRALQK